MNLVKKAQQLINAILRFEKKHGKTFWLKKSKSWSMEYILQVYRTLCKEPQYLPTQQENNLNLIRMFVSREWGFKKRKSIYTRQIESRYNLNIPKYNQGAFQTNTQLKPATKAVFICHLKRKDDFFVGKEMEGPDIVWVVRWIIGCKLYTKMWTEDWYFDKKKSFNGTKTQA